LSTHRNYTAGRQQALVVLAFASLLFIGCSSENSSAAGGSSTATGNSSEARILSPNPQADPLPDDIAVPQKTILARCITTRDEPRQKSLTTISGQLADAKNADKVLQECISLVEGKGWKCTPSPPNGDARGATMQREGRTGSISVYSSPKRDGLMLMIQIEEQLPAK